MKYSSREHVITLKIVIDSLSDRQQHSTTPAAEGMHIYDEQACERHMIEVAPYAGSSSLNLPSSVPHIQNYIHHIDFFLQLVSADALM